MTGFTPKQRLLIALTSHLVLLTMLYQIMAFEHWHASEVDIAGALSGSQHCHGAASSCVTTTSTTTSLAVAPTVLPMPPASFLSVIKLTVHASQGFANHPDQPPRS